jgi:hypothetical protein
MAGKGRGPSKRWFDSSRGKRKALTWFGDAGLTPGPSDNVFVLLVRRSPAPYKGFFLAGAGGLGRGVCGARNSLRTPPSAQITPIAKTRTMMRTMPVGLSPVTGCPPRAEAVVTKAIEAPIPTTNRIRQHSASSSPTARPPGLACNLSIASYASHAADWLREREHPITGRNDPDLRAQKASEMKDEIAY